jgi:hypothetical protein
MATPKRARKLRRLVRWASRRAVRANQRSMIVMDSP